MIIFSINPGSGIRKHICTTLLIISVFFTLIPLGLTGQEASVQQAIDTTSSVDIEEVVITATRFNTIISKTPEAINTVNQDLVLQRQYRTTPEALQLTPGVFVQKTNHGGGSPFLRGLTGNQILMLVDGIRLSNATMRYGPNQYLNTIDVFSIERMEVLRGGGSVQYGSDAMGGTIQTFSHELLTTEKPHWGGAFHSRIATHGMEKSLHSNLTYSASKVSFRAGLTTRFFGDKMGGDTTGRQTPSGYDEIDYDLKGKILISPSTDLTLSYQSVSQSDVPVYHKIVLEDYLENKMDPQKRKLGYLRINRKMDAGVFKSLRLTASIQNTEEGRESQKNGSSVYRFENDRVRSLGFSSEIYTSDDDAWTSGSGVEIYNDYVKSTRTDTDLSDNTSVSKRGLYPDGSTMTSIALFTTHTVDLPQWNFTAGARFNSFIIVAEDETLGETKLTPTALVANLGLMRKLAASSNLFVSLNKGFRAPNIDDMGTLGIVDFRYETPNYDLKPEHSLQYQAGYKFNARRLRGELYFYRNELYDLIVRTRVEGEFIEGYPVYRKENSDQAYIQGIETAWEYSPLPAWNINGNLTYTYGQNKTLDEPVRRIPPLFGGVTLEYKYKKLWIDMGWQASGLQDRLSQGDMDDNRIPEGGTPGWSILNIDTGISFGILKTSLSVRNIFNQDYRYHGSGINGYGRSALLSVTFMLPPAPPKAGF